MSKKVINQKTNYDSELLKSIESNFIFDENPINRLKNTASNLKRGNETDDTDKKKRLNELKLQINSIIELAAEYLVMAAMLAEIKSRLLLPRHSEVADEEADPRAELIRRLQEYEVFKQAATELDSLPRDERDHFNANAGLADNFAPLLILPDVDLAELTLALKDIVKRAKDFQHHHIKREHLSTRERMSRILDLLSQHNCYLAFSGCFEVAEGREGVVVTFLAILELTKEKLVEIIQVEAYGQIHVKLKAGEA